ncbi:MAG: UV DNA damage repair endonuclease UvsE [Clostridium sp.]|nr:UV DNA damage repair endonuclease UvsE [Clostridium sp.]MCM1444448.1 UV DNA damage repair endonuclease UvsE [Candidatus Amulumruptor caecigallinarius]
MIIRLGYVSISKTLEKYISFHTITYTDFCKDNDYKKLDIIIKENFKTLKEILIYNKKNNIHFYRLTSKFIPLATHKELNFDYIEKYKILYDEISKLIKDIRIDTHPDQFTVLNSTKKEVLDGTFRILEYHYKILNALKVENPIIILHVGSSVFGKENSIKRFIHNFKLLPNYIKKCIALENDDKIYNVKDVLKLCQTLNVPFVFDYHHYRCNNEGENYLDYIEDIFKTWKDRKPKIHFSSPKNKTKKDFRSHSDYIDIDDFISFLESVKKFNIDFDIMLEAKAKDDAIFRLVREIKYKTNYKFIDDTTFII